MAEMDIEKILKWGLIFGALGIGGFVIYKIMSKMGYLTAPTLTAQPRSQVVTTSGVRQPYSPRTSYRLGNAGSTREVALSRLPEDHVRGAAVTPEWRKWGSGYGSILPEGVTGTFNGAPIGLTIPEERHVTPQVEAYLAESVRRRLWLGGGQPRPSGTFG